MSTTQIELLKSLAKEIRDEHRIGGNTATKVGTLLLALAERSFNLDDIAGEYLSKTSPDSATELITFLEGVAIGASYGITKEGVATLSKLGIGNSVLSVVDGRSKLVIDEIEVLAKAMFEELQIRRTSYVGGSFMASHAGITCTAVEAITTNGTTTAYKCSFKSSEDGKTIESGFSVGSLAYCKEFGESATQYYWRKVTTVGDDYITLSAAVGEFADGSTSPLAGDNIVARGHATDTDLQNVIEIASVGTGSPSIVLYQGIDGFTTVDKDVLSFSFVNGKLKFTSYGDVQIGDRDGSTGLFFDSVTKVLKVKAKEISLAKAEGGETTVEDATTSAGVKEAKKSIDAQYKAIEPNYNSLYNNTNLTGVDKSNLNTAYSAIVSAKGTLDTAVNNLLNSTDSPIPDSLTTAYTNAYTNYSTKLEAYYTKSAAAQKAIETKIKSDGEGYTDDKVDAIEVGTVNLLDGTSNEVRSVTFSGWQAVLHEYDYVVRGETYVGRIWLNPEGQEASIMLSVQYTDGTYYERRGNIIAAGESGYSKVDITIPDSDNGINHLAFRIRHSSSTTPVDTCHYKEDMLVKGNKIDGSWDSSANDKRTENNEYTDNKFDNLSINTTNLCSGYNEPLVEWYDCSGDYRLALQFKDLSVADKIALQGKKLTVAFSYEASGFTSTTNFIGFQFYVTYTDGTQTLIGLTRVNASNYTEGMQGRVTATYQLEDKEIDSITSYQPNFYGAVCITGTLRVGRFTFLNSDKDLGWGAAPSDQEITTRNEAISAFFGNITAEQIDEMVGNSNKSPFVFDTNTNVAYLANAIITKLASDSAFIDSLTVKVLKAIDSQNRKLLSINEYDDGRIIMYNNSGKKRLELYPSDEDDEAGIKIYSPQGKLSAVMGSDGLYITLYNKWITLKLVYVCDTENSPSWSNLPEAWQDGTYAGADPDAPVIANQLKGYTFETTNSEYNETNGFTIRKRGEAPTSENVPPDYNGYGNDDGNSFSLAIGYKAHGYYIIEKAGVKAGELFGVPYYKRTTYKYVNGYLVSTGYVQSNIVN